jgi:glycosyltransferase involved in cell wall biosynthesis
MRILFLTQVLPYPLDAGPKVRAYYVLRHLARSHAVTLVSFVRSTDTAAAGEHLRQYCQAVHTLPMPRSRAGDAAHALRSLATNQPFIILRDWVPGMADLIGNVVSEAGPFDVVHADQLWMAAYALYARQAHQGRRRPALVLDQHNAVYLVPARIAEAETSRAKRMLLRLEAKKLASYEVQTCRQFDRVVWVTREDHTAVVGVAARKQQKTETRHRRDPSTIVTNSAVIPICADPEATAVIARRPAARRVTFLGGLHWPPNAQGILWFAERVFPRVLESVPDAVMTVIGKNPQHIPNAHSQLPAARLEVTGYVDDPRPYLEDTAVFAVPLLAGGGMRVKIVDAWTWGLPVVSTSIGAEGIDIRPGENILIADTPAEFAQATVQLLQDRDRNEALAEGGRRWVEEHYSWRRVYPSWDRIYDELAAKG